MRTQRSEQVRAEQLSAAIDGLIQRPEGQPVPADSVGQTGLVDPADAGLLDTAGQLARLPSLLGPAIMVAVYSVFARLGQWNINRQSGLEE